MDLPRGLYRYGQKYRARAWGPNLLAHKAPGLEPKWKVFHAPIGDAVKAFYEWRGTPIAKGEVRRALLKYLDSPKFKKLAPSSQRTERPRVMKLIAVYGDMNLRDLEPRHIYGFLEVEPLQGGKKTMKRFSAIMSQWEAMGLVQRNFIPAVLKAWGIPDNKRTRYVNDAELQIALEVCRERFPMSHGAVIAYCHMKLTELVGRRVTDVRTLSRRFIRKGHGVEFTESKTGKSVFVESTPELESVIEEVKSLCKPGWTLITNRDGNQVSEGSLNQAFQRLRPHFRKAGIADFQPRDIRAKYSTDREEQHGDGFESLGHSSRRTFDDHYNRKPKKISPLR